MDYQYLETMLNNLEKTSVSIKGTASYCTLHHSSAEIIATLIKDNLERARRDKKILFMYVIHETMLESKKKGHKEFIIHFGNKLHSMVTHLSNQIDKYEDMKELKSLIMQWGKEELFAKNFIDKLNHIVLPKYKALYTESLNYGQKQKEEKYNEQFIKNYKTIQESELGRKIYNMLFELSKVQNSIDQFNFQANEFKLDTDLEDQKNLEKLEQTGDEARRHKNELMDKIVELQHIYQEVSTLCENELIDYTRRRQE